MAGSGFWDRVLELILSRGQREKHEKFLWDKKCGGGPVIPALSCTSSTITSTSSASPLNRPSLERLNSPSSLKPTVRSTEPPQRIASTTSVVSQGSSTNSPTLSTPSTTPLTHFSSPIHSVSGSPTHHALASKAMANYASRGPLPRRPREDRAYLSLEPLVEAQKLMATEKPWVPKLEAIELPVPTKSSPPLYEKPIRPMMRRLPLLYEVPQLSETQGVGKYRRSVNATEQFIDATTNNRNDSFSDLLALVVGEKTSAGGEWVRPARIHGNMDTTSPPPPRRAFSRGNSPVRFAIYGEGVDEVAEEELEERDGKLIFGRRRTRGSSLRCADNADGSDQGNNNNNNNNEEKTATTTLVTTSDPGVMTTEAIVTTIAEEKQATKKKQTGVSRDDEGVRGRKKNTAESRNLHRATLVMKSKAETNTRIRHVITPTEAIEEALETPEEDDDVEEVESFSDRGMMLAKKGGKTVNTKTKAAKNAATATNNTTSTTTTVTATTTKVAVKKPAAAKAASASGGSKEKEKVLKAPEPAKKKRVIAKNVAGSGVGGAVVKAATKRAVARK
ncbi:hypothetical protein DFH27DRAFT_606559 [Peziza echinospora]|nr:hypothetical protein DFH27DRAFT_606559 [Peziza echinospora]